MKQVYPTFIVNTNDGSEHSFLACVPDMEIFTEGDTFADAIEMARDAIGLAGISMEDNKEELPVPSDQNAAIEKVKRDTEDIDFSEGILTYVDVDFSEYRKKSTQKLSGEMSPFQVGLIMRLNTQELMFQGCCRKH